MGDVKEKLNNVNKEFMKDAINNSSNEQIKEFFKEKGIDIHSKEEILKYIK